jgi:hypothetical protein
MLHEVQILAHAGIFTDYREIVKNFPALAPFVGKPRPMKEGPGQDRWRPA